MKTDVLSVAIVVGLAVGCGGPRDPVVMRYGSTTVTSEDLLDEARSDRYRGLSPEQRADFALRQLLMTAHLVAEPAGDDELEMLKRRKARLVSQRCLAVKLKQRVAASPIDMETKAAEYFESHRDEFSVPDRFVLDMIFIPVEEEGSDALARQVLEQIERDPGRFAELAREHSRSETAATGGRTRPIPATAVHPEIRRAVERHRGSDRPFLVTIDRGHYIVRVVQFWPQIDAEFDQVRNRVVEAVRHQAMDELYREAGRGVARAAEIEVRTDLLLSPRVPANEAVVAIDGRWYTVKDVLPAVGAGKSVPGTVLAKEIVNFRRWVVASEYYGCPEPQDPEISEVDLAGSRLDDALHRYALANMRDEIRRYHSVHGEALVSPPEFTFDLYVFPFDATDPFADHARYRDLMDAVGSNATVDGTRFEEAGVSVSTDVVMTDAEAARYDRVLIGILSSLDEGAVSRPLRAAGPRAWIMVRLVGKTDPRPLSPDDPDDLAAIAEQYVEDSREHVVETLYSTIRREAVVDDAVLAQCVDTLRTDAAVSHGD